MKVHRFCGPFFKIERTSGHWFDLEDVATAYEIFIKNKKRLLFLKLKKPLSKTLKLKVKSNYLAFKNS